MMSRSANTDAPGVLKVTDLGLSKEQLDEFIRYSPMLPPEPRDMSAIDRATYWFIVCLPRRPWTFGLFSKRK